MRPEDRIQIGVVGKPHGVRGAFHLDGCIDAPALVSGLKLRAGDDELTLASRGGTDARPLLTVAEISDRDAIGLLRGRAVTVARGDLTPLEDGEWYADDLIGLKVVDGDGSELGTVTRMNNLPSVDVLEVARTGGEALLVPMVKDAIVRIDPEGEITVNAEFLDLG